MRNPTPRPTLVRKHTHRPVIPSYTDSMKTAISLPDALFARVERQVAELDINRSQFFAQAVERYLGELEQRSVTRRLDRAVAIDAGRSADEARDFAEFSTGRLAEMTSDDEW